MQGMVAAERMERGGGGGGGGVALRVVAGHVMAGWLAGDWQQGLASGAGGT